MTETTEIRVPDIGDFSDVAVIEVLIKPGDELAIDQTMIVLESDKAALDVPSPVEGRITAVHVAVGDRVSKGSLVAAVEAKGTRPAPEVRPAVAEAATTPTPTPADPGGFDCDVVVIGGGPGGYSAAFRAADLGLRVILVEKDPTLGGVCLNVGCIPSKALLHVAAVKEEAERLAGHGVAFGPPQVDLDRLRAFKSGVVKRLTDGLSAMARMRKVDIVHGTGRFASANKLAVSGGDPADRIISFKQCIIAAGSEPVSLPFLPPSVS
jgi:dihydrolipoamide dehydrogenase